MTVHLESVPAWSSMFQWQLQCLQVSRIVLSFVICFCSTGSVRSRAASSKGTVLCHFHVVLVKSEFNFKPEKDVLTLRCHVAKLGGWDDRNHVMSVEK